MKIFEALGLLFFGLIIVVVFGQKKSVLLGSFAGGLVFALVVIGGYGLVTGAEKPVPPLNLKNLIAWVSDPVNQASVQWNPTLPLLSTPTTTYRQITWMELVKFIEDDHTNWNKYDPIKYDCLDFAVDLVANAHKQNIKAWVVAVEFYNQPVGHAFVGFETTDRGIVYIEPQGDNTYIDMKVGQYLCDAWGKYECMGKIKSIDYEQCDHSRFCTSYMP